ncbi:MAG: ribose 5-phosphate isomerase B [Myxococcales bacterium]|jgi:ribose 5-phosphate isomerase B|nr:ribose 5-phosphate isomerase B [Myxococcales bacterium]
MSQPILIASDHAGFSLKQQLLRALDAQSPTLHDLGTHSEDSVDYTTYAHLLADKISANEAPLGILICGTGIGMSMAANRHKNIRAALCQCPYSAQMARAHNDANVLCLGGRVIACGLALEIVQAFVHTPFQGGRHERRIQQIELP